MPQVARADGLSRRPVAYWVAQARVGPRAAATPSIEAGETRNFTAIDTRPCARQRRIEPWRLPAYEHLGYFAAADNVNANNSTASG